ncbi:MAG: polymer-forming cytoskeletal protein [bacterium]
MKRFYRLAAFVLFALVLLPMKAEAQSTTVTDVILPAGDVINDNFVRVGKNVEINGTVHGDLIVAGQSVTVNGAITGDILAAAQTIRIEGPVSGNIRVAGAEVTVNGAVGKNATIFAETIRLGDKAAIEWSLQAFGSTIDLGGQVAGNANFYGTSATVRGTIEGNARFLLGREGTLRLAPTAVIGKDVEYRTNRDAIIDAGALVTGTTHKTLPAPQDTRVRSFLASLVSIWRLVSIFGLLVVGLILLSLFPKTSARIAERMQQRPWQSIGWGLVILIVAPIVALILLFTVIGIPLALLGVALYVMLLYLAKVFVGFSLGLILFRALRKEKPAPVLWSFIVGTVLFTILTILPYIGWLIEFVGILWAAGAAVFVKREVLQATEK